MPRPSVNMDVVCGRCRAEYEFDDALISERGTTVRCTNCGLQFKIFPPVGQRAAELWRVYREGHLETPVLEYESLEELQRGIATARVLRSDWLARGDHDPRPLAEIIELQPLLGQRRSERPPPGDTASDLPPLRLGSSGTVIGIGTSTEVGTAFGAPSPPQALKPEPDSENGADGNQQSQIAHDHESSESTPGHDSERSEQLQTPPESKPRHEPAVPLDLDPQSIPPESIKELSSAVHNAIVEKWVEELEEEVRSAAANSAPENELEDVVDGYQPEAPSPGSFSTTALGNMPTSPARQPEGSNKPKIRSALSHSNMSGPDVPPNSVKPPRSSLLARTFIGGTPPPVEQEPPSSGNRGGSYPPPLPGTTGPNISDSVPLSRTAASAGQSPQEREPAAVVPRLTPGDFTETDSEPPDSTDLVSEPPSSGSRHTDRPAPEDRQSDPISQRVTPMRAAEEVNARPSSATQPPASKSGTFSLLLIFVAATAGGMLLWSQTRGGNQVETSKPSTPAPVADRAPPPEPEPKVEEAASSPKLSAEEQKNAWEKIEITWWKKVLSEDGDASLEASEGAQLAEQLENEPSWMHVNLLRAVGQIKEARTFAMKLEADDADYALATLDLAEADAPPWALLRERYQTAATGEQAPFFARTALIYVTAKSGQLELARADYESFKKMPGAVDSPLYQALGQFLLDQAAPSQDVTQQNKVTPNDTAEPSSILQPKPKSVPSATKAKVEQADKLWRGGKRDQAVQLYRQVVSEIGTSHFLGQRSAARIAQAAREKAESEKAE